MRTSLDGQHFIQGFEGNQEILPGGKLGIPNKAYFDIVGVPTIAYGHTREVSRQDVLEGKTITQAEAEELFRQDIEPLENGISNALHIPVTQGMFDALVSFAFNLGLNALLNSTLMRILNQGDYAGAAEQFLRWNKAGGKVVTGLDRRRKAERRLFLTPGPKFSV